MKTIAYYQRKPETGIGIARHIGFDNNEDFLFSWDLFAEEGEEEKGFAVRKVDVKEQWDQIDFDPSTLERMTCGRRAEDMQLKTGNENRDYWRKEEERGYKACSYCGSASFELFTEVIEAVLADKPDYGIERATGKNYKYYLRTPEKHQIKFYTPHIPKEIFDDRPKLEELDAKLKDACTKSWDRFMKKHGR